MHRREAGMPKRHRRGDADQPGGRGGRVVRGFLGGLRFGEDARGVLGERLAAFGQRQPARGAVEQRLAELRLEPGDRLGDGRLGHADRVGGAAERAMLDDAGEDRPGFEIGQAHADLPVVPMIGSVTRETIGFHRFHLRR